MTRANAWQRSVALSFRLSRCQRKSGLAVAVLELVWVLAHVVSDLLDLLKVRRPLGHAIGRLLLLQTPQDGLVLDRNFHQLILSLHSVQTCLFNSIRVVKAGLVFLHNVGHFLEQNPVFSLDLSITPYFKNQSISIRSYSSIRKSELTLEHGVFFRIAHRDIRFVRLSMLCSNGRSHFS